MSQYGWKITKCSETLAHSALWNARNRNLALYFCAHFNCAQHKGSGGKCNEITSMYETNKKFCFCSTFNGLKEKIIKKKINKALMTGYNPSFLRASMSKFIKDLLLFFSSTKKRMEQNNTYCTMLFWGECIDRTRLWVPIIFCSYRHKLGCTKSLFTIPININSYFD